jgi:TatD DNase family protein
MNSIPFVDIHTHLQRPEKETIKVQNIFPGEGFAAFSGRNFYSVGLHPWHIKTPEENNEMLQQVEEALEFDHVIFVGETGLDKRTDTDFEEQKRVFQAQAFMAEEIQKPLIIHCVKAYNEILEIHKKMNPKMTWIFHSYNGSVEITRQLANQNFLFSFGEILFLPGTKAIDSFKILPLHKIFFETDEYNGEVEQMYKQGARLKNIPEEEVAMAVWDNFNRIENKLISRF